jgi:hypothetical protein
MSFQEIGHERKDYGTWLQTALTLVAGTRRHWSLSENEETPQWGTNLKTTGTTSTHPSDHSFRLGSIALSYTSKMADETVIGMFPMLLLLPMLISNCIHHIEMELGRIIIHGQKC